MAQIIEKIIRSKYPPRDTRVLWLDSNTGEIKSYTKGVWVSTGEVKPAPSNPVIVANLASLPGEVEVFVNIINYADYPGGVDYDEDLDSYFIKTLKAGHIIKCAEDGHIDTLDINTDGEFANVGGNIKWVGVLMNDTPTYKDKNGLLRAKCSIMLIGVANEALMPAKVYRVEKGGGSLFGSHIVTI